MLALLFFNMQTIARGSLVEILSKPPHQSQPLLGLVLDVANVSEKWFFQVKYVEAGTSDTRWVHQKFIKRC